MTSARSLLNLRSSSDSCSNLGSGATVRSHVIGHSMPIESAGSLPPLACPSSPTARGVFHGSGTTCIAVTVIPTGVRMGNVSM